MVTVIPPFFFLSRAFCTRLHEQPVHLLINYWLMHTLFTWRMHHSSENMYTPTLSKTPNWNNFANILSTTYPRLDCTLSPQNLPMWRILYVGSFHLDKFDFPSKWYNIREKFICHASSRSHFLKRSVFLVKCLTQEGAFKCFLVRAWYFAVARMHTDSIKRTVERSFVSNKYYFSASSCESKRELCLEIFKTKSRPI